jgi:hypothetical protein
MCRALAVAVTLGGTKATKTKELLIKKTWNGRSSWSDDDSATEPPQGEPANQMVTLRQQGHRIQP